MTMLAEIDDRAACSTWCPQNSHPDVVAVGTKDSGGVGFEDTGGELELYDLSLGKSGKPTLLGSVKVPARFSTVSWTTYTAEGRYPLGLLAGGMVDGTIHIWNPEAIIKQLPRALLHSVKRHENGPIGALQFNKSDPSQLATGGCNGQVIIIDLQAGGAEPVVSEPCPGHKQAAEITAVAWNPQVPHILASSAGDGSVAVWDLKSHKAWCELRAETAGQAVADMCWNPAQGLHLLTASADDRNPVIKVWDLRASTSMPLATLAGHSAGLLKVNWCPHDDTLLLSCAKDMRTLLWDLVTMQPIAELPNADAVQEQGGAAAASPGALFSSSSLAEQKHMRYDIKWSPLKRGVALTCSLGRKVQAHSVLSLATKSGRPPKWMKTPSGVKTGFGGTLISFGAGNKVVSISNIQEQPIVAQTSQRSEGELAAANMNDFCQARRAGTPPGSADSEIWAFMQIIFAANARQYLLTYLGFDASKIAAATSAYSEDDATNGMASLSVKDEKPIPAMSAGTQEIVKRALLVGNFEAAVDCCFRTGNLSDALILASCGGAELWAKSQERFFKMETPKRPFLNIVSGVIMNQLDTLVTESDLRNWEETLAILSTYGQSDEFPKLCIALGDRLEQSGDAQNASLCYMCALNLESSVRFWKGQLDKANKAKGSLDLLALHDFVLKVSIFLNATGSSDELSPEISQLFSKYAQVLAEQGLFATAAKYCKGSSEESKILRDRLYRSRASQRCLAVLGNAPEFPYTYDPSQPSRRVQLANRKAQEAAQQAAAQQAQQAQAAAQQAQQTAQQAQTNQQQTQAPAQQPTPASDQLPPGWIAIPDPASGNTYYANQNTGEVTWEKPQVAPTSRDNVISPVSNNSSHARQVENTTQKVISKYGDGFVTSSSHPELANQYGNHGTSNPYHVSSRTGTAAAMVNTSTKAKPGQSAPVSSSEDAPISGSLDFSSIQLPEEYVPIKDTLLGFITALQSSNLTSSDKRQLTEAEKGVAILIKKIGLGRLSSEIISKVMQLTGALANRDFGTSGSIQTALVNSDWKEHKDWLKGVKLLIQLSSKFF